ncbi:hypothetical protein [Paenibacillus sp. NPDC057934]|uniref:hypothetical protein n=1 Tax=Paenibacillus sp. NPDC057934 TaxID=3346282 RepID=UPI0036DE31EB
MLDFVLFMFFSVIESFSMFLLSFRLFKIDLYIVEMLFASIIMAFISYVLRHDYSFPIIDIATQYFLTFCFFWMLFRIQVFYAVIITGIAYQSYMLIQSLLFLFMNQLGIYSLPFKEFSSISYLLQFLSSLITVIIGAMIANKRKGFDFIPDKPNGRIDITFKEKILFALSLPSILVVMSTLFFASHLTRFFIVIPTAYALILYGYLYLSYKKDRGESWNH